MKKVLSLLSLVVLLAGCGPKGSQESASSGSGEKILFDGKTMDGWRTFKNKPQDNWEVVDGTLHSKPIVDGVENVRADLMTVDEYDNFEFSFEWKISVQGNSGVIYRATEEYNQPYESGPEYQILDDEGYPGDKKAEWMTAANYDVQAVAINNTKPVGEWNTGKIIANGNHVEHWLNGKKVLEYEFGSDDWKQRVANSKWKDSPGYGLSKKGHIDLQDHSHEVWFRNIKIKEIKG